MSRFFFFLLFVLPCVAFSANDVQVKLNGKLDFQSITYHHDSHASQLSPLRKTFAFNNSASVVAKVSNKIDSGMTYGAMVNLRTTNRNNRSTSSGLYLVTNYGKLEFGSDKSAAAKMKISSFSNAAATGGGVDSFINSDPRKTNTLYITGWANFLDAKIRPSANKHNAEYARKITYYTPDISGFQMGISYIPDSTNRGYKSFHSDSESSVKTQHQKYKVHFIDGVAAGISYGKKYSSDFSMRSSIVFEKAKTVSDKKNPTDAKFSNLKNYVIGTEIKYQNFSVAASFGDYLKSATNDVVNNLGKKTHIYGVTVRYDINKLSMSLSGFRSHHYTNKFSSATLAMDYKIAPGILPYAEVTFYEAKGRTLKNKSIFSHSSKGNLVILGAKFEF